MYQASENINVTSAQLTVQNFAWTMFYKWGVQKEFHPQTDVAWTIEEN